MNKIKKIKLVAYADKKEGDFSFRRVSSYDKEGVVDQKRFTTAAEATDYAKELAAKYNVEIVEEQA